MRVCCSKIIIQESNLRDDEKYLNDRVLPSEGLLPPDNCIESNPKPGGIVSEVIRVTFRTRGVSLAPAQTDTKGIACAEGFGEIQINPRP